MHKIKKVRRVLRIGNGQPANYIVWRVTTPGGNKKTSVSVMKPKTIVSGSH